jgi:hypothetical protein
MSVEDPSVVDFVGFDERAGEVVLTISDHLYWHQEGHLELLERKIAAYLSFTTSGALTQQYPQAADRKVVFLLASQYFMSRRAEAFFAERKTALATSGVELRFVRPSDGENRFSRWVNSWLEPWLQR